MKDVRCPICGGIARYNEQWDAHTCGCLGHTSVFRPSYWTAEDDERIEVVRRRCEERGRGWSWFTAKPHTHGPEDFGDR